MTSQVNKIETIHVAKSDFVITVEMWVRTFNVKMLKHQYYFGGLVCCARISSVVGHCVTLIFHIQKMTNAHISY